MKRRPLTYRKLKNQFVKLFSTTAVLLAVGAMLWILYTVACYGIRSMNLSFFTTPTMPYGVTRGGIANAFLGSVMITFGAAVLAVPPALCAGIFLAEYKDWKAVSSILRFSANVMMGIPSVLVGLFVYIILVMPTGNFSGFAASVALAIIMFPVVMRTTEDMLGMVPDALRESALALGMTRTRATVCIVCQSARKGLLTGILLALSRVSGETAPLLFTALFSDGWPKDYFTGPTANMPVLITEYSTNSPFEVMHQAGWGAALVVTVMVLVINLSTRIIFREKKI
ncbi:MAG: Phosphate transport system permease protein PstA [Lentisphaerae bacterium ADurb.Bin242]|nr:MAG: Phosphate transport system permease protein PstA [Lentisphaerae bacterium ADurb.Bin242]